MHSRNSCHSQGISIRPYEAVEDLDILSGIWLDASRAAHGFIGEQRLLEQQVLVETQYLPNAETFVAVLEQERAGFISLLGSFIGGLFVAPAHQGRGVGKALVAHALSARGELELEVYTANAQALAFYGSLGFVEISRRPRDDEGRPFENARLRLQA